MRTVPIRHPEDLKKVRHFLQEKGLNYQNDVELQNLYEDFSAQMYCAGWIMVDQDNLESFYRWLCEEFP